MRLGYFTMPVHPLTRDWAQTLREDREAIILADKLGFHDAFVGEHLTDACERITNSMLFLATLIADTKTIKLATGTTNLSHMHPVVIAQNAAMFDHLAQGPLHLRHQPGRARLRRRGARHAGGRPQQDVRRGDRRHSGDLGARAALRHRLAEQPLQGRDQQERHRIDLGIGIMGKPYQKPRPEIVGTVVAPFSPGVRADGQARLPSAVGELPAGQASQVALGELRQGQGRGRRKGRRQRLARRAHHFRRRRRQDRARATAATNANSPYRFYFEQMLRQDEAQQPALCVQEPQGTAGRRDHARLRHGPLRHQRHASTRWSTRSWRCARRPAISANWFMPAWIGSIRRWPSGR